MIDITTTCVVKFTLDEKEKKRVVELGIDFYDSKIKKQFPYYDVSYNKYHNGDLLSIQVSDIANNPISTGSVIKFVNNLLN